MVNGENDIALYVYIALPIRVYIGKTPMALLSLVSCQVVAEVMRFSWQDR